MGESDAEREADVGLRLHDHITLVGLVRDLHSMTQFGAPLVELGYRIAPYALCTFKVELVGTEPVSVRWGAAAMSLVLGSRYPSTRPELAGPHVHGTTRGDPWATSLGSCRPVFYSARATSGATRPMAITAPAIVPRSRDSRLLLSVMLVSCLSLGRTMRATWCIRYFDTSLPHIERNCTTALVPGPRW